MTSIERLKEFIDSFAAVGNSQEIKDHFDPSIAEGKTSRFGYHSDPVIDEALAEWEVSSTKEKAKNSDLAQVMAEYKAQDSEKYCPLPTHTAARMELRKKRREEKLRHK